MKLWKVQPQERVTTSCEAKAFGKMLKSRLAKFGLKVCKNKSQTIEFGRYAWGRAQ